MSFFPDILRDEDNDLRKQRHAKVHVSTVEKDPKRPMPRRRESPSSSL